MKIFEPYNNKKINKLMPFIHDIYVKNHNKEKSIIEKRNQAKGNPPEILTHTVFIRKNKPGKTDPIYDIIDITKKTEIVIVVHSIKIGTSCN